MTKSVIEAAKRIIDNECEQLECLHDSRCASGDYEVAIRYRYAAYALGRVRRELSKLEEPEEVGTPK